MKGATHNLVVRTRTDVALYVLNHKRGHLRDLEDAFKVSLAVVADPTVSGQQSFIIDRGEQVHTLEAAKALLAAQVAASPPQHEEALDEDEAFDIEVESEVETEESEGVVAEQPASEGAAADGEADGHKRKRRRRRRGRPGEPRDGAPAQEENGAPRAALTAIPGAVANEAESDDDEADEQPGMARTDQATGERRPRRRGRRGGRRRRGGPEDGLVGSIADELAPPPPSEVSSAVADFDEVAPQPPAPAVEAETFTAPAEPHPADHDHEEPAGTAGLEEDRREAENGREPEKAPPRRSTVREKVTFLSEPQPVVTSSADHGEPQPLPPEPNPSQSPAPAPGENQPRRAGWWSRRFGSGE